MSRPRWAGSIIDNRPLRSFAGRPKSLMVVQMNALMGLLAITLTETIMTQISDTQLAMRTMRAFEKLMWIQNDFINRHYQS